MNNACNLFYKLTFFSVAFLYSLFLIHYLAPSAHAASSSQVIRVSPVIVHLNLTPANTTTYEITVENLLNTPLPVKAIYNDFETSAEDGGYILTSTNSNSILSWVTLDNKEWIIPAKTKQQVSLTIKTPHKVSLGGYYGLLFFQPMLPLQGDKTIVSARVGVLLLGDIGGGKTNDIPGEVLTFDLPVLSQTNILPLLLRVKNTSMNFFTAKPILRIKPLLGPERLQFIEEKLIFPAKIRRWENPIKLENTGIGIYTITLTVAMGDGKNVQQTRTLIIVPWVPFLVGFLSLFIIIGGIKKRKKLAKAFTAFFSKETQE